MLRIFLFLLALLVSSCSDDKAAPSAFDTKAGPWQTITVNGAVYRLAAGKANASSQQTDLALFIPYSISGSTIVFGESAST